MIKKQLAEWSVEKALEYIEALVEKLAEDFKNEQFFLDFLDALNKISIKY